MSMIHLWMDQPVRGETVSEEDELVQRGGKGSGSLWHRLHLHSSAGSRWKDERIDGQTEPGEGETYKHLRVLPLLHHLLFTQSCCKRKEEEEEEEEGDAKR